MNKNANYSNTVIYKICCKDPNITDVYVGHTTNFFTRKQCHINCCNNKNNNLYNSKLYKCIRENGGWENWEIIEIAKYNLKNYEEARIKEQDHYEKLKANLNSFSPYTKIKKNILKQSDKYDETQKYICENCKYSTNEKSSFNKHKLTIKHNNLIITKNNNLCESKYKCLCGLNYDSRTSFWRHKKICEKITNTENDILNNKNNQTEIQILTQSISDLVKSNKEMLEFMKNYIISKELKEK